MHKFSFLCRTIPNIKNQLQPLENCIRLHLIPALTGRSPSDVERSLLGLPPRLGGMGITNPTTTSTQEYTASSLCRSASLSESNCWSIPSTALRHRQLRRRWFDGSTTTATRPMYHPSAPAALQRAMDLAQERGASSWLMSLPLKEFNLCLHKDAFWDVITLRYSWQPENTPTHCSCGSSFSVEHTLSCAKGGFPILRHNEVRDLTANLMAEVCHDVCTEPHLQPLTGEQLTGASSITDNGARLDIATSRFWGGWYERAFFDVRVFNPHASSNHQPLASCYRKHENAKKRVYEQRVREIEHGSFTPLILSATGGLGNAATVRYKRLASMIADKRSQPYSSTMSWLRCTLSFTLLLAAIQCIRGSRSRSGHTERHIPEMDFVLSEA